MAFGARMRDRREELGMSQKDLSVACAMDDTMISRIERGATRNVWLSTALRIAKGLKSKVDDLCEPDDLQ